MTVRTDIGPAISSTRVTTPSGARVVITPHYNFSMKLDAREISDADSKATGLSRLMSAARRTGRCEVVRGLDVVVRSHHRGPRSPGRLSMWRVMPETTSLFRNGAFRTGLPVVRWIAHPPGAHNDSPAALILALVEYNRSVKS